MLLTSSWKVTWAGITLLDFDDLMNDEPSLSRNAPVDITPVLSSDNPAIFARKNVTHELSFSRVKVHDSDEAARLFLLTHAASLPFDQTYDCVIYLLQGDLSV